MRRRTLRRADDEARLISLLASSKTFPSARSHARHPLAAAAPTLLLGGPREHLGVDGHGHGEEPDQGAGEAEPAADGGFPDEYVDAVAGGSHFLLGAAETVGSFRRMDLLMRRVSEMSVNGETAQQLANPRAAPLPWILSPLSVRHFFVFFLSSPFARSPHRQGRAWM